MRTGRARDASLKKWLNTKEISHAYGASRLHLWQVQGRPARTMVGQFVRDTLFKSPANPVTSMITWCQRVISCQMWHSGTTLKSIKGFGVGWTSLLTYTLTIKVFFFVFFDVVWKRNPKIMYLFNFFFFCIFCATWHKIYLLYSSTWVEIPKTWSFTPFPKVGHSLSQAA